MAFPSGAAVVEDFSTGSAMSGKATFTVNPFYNVAWTTDATIGSGLVQAGSSVSYGHWWYNAATYGPDAECYATTGSAFTGAEAYVGCRILQPSGSSATADGYIYYIYEGAANSSRLYRVDNTAFTGIGTAHTVSSPQGFGIRAVGSTISAWVKSGGVWSQTDSTTDATYNTAGYTMFLLRGTNGNLTDFAAGTYAAGAAPAIRRRPSGLYIR